MAVPSYLAKYNSYTLPGYVQNESFDSVARIAQHYADFADGSLSEMLGLQNKQISLTLKVWEDDYETCKQKVQQAATMLRSKRDGFAPLYVQFNDRYYEALTSSIKVEKAAGTSVKTLEYIAEFEAKPWAVSTVSYTVSGNALNGAGQTITTTGRTIDDGGWSYTSIRLSGTNVTVSGYTDNGDFTGFMSVSGAIANLTVDSEAFTATTNNGTVNRNNYMKVPDYRVYIGPEVTNFRVTGAQICEVTYHKRWYI